MLTQIFTAAVLLTPPSTAPTFDANDVTVDKTEDAATVTITTDGVVSMEIVVWSVNGQPRIDALFADGGYVSWIDGDVHADLPDPAAAAALLARTLEGHPQAHETAWPCIGSIALTTAAVLTGSVPAAFGAGVFLACNCLPLIDPEVEC